jgi:hypothetical protein
MRTAHVRTAFVAAPAFLLLGVLGMKLGWKANPDLEWTVAFPLWTGAHLAYILGNLAMLVVLAALWALGREGARSSSARGAVTAVAAAGVIGTVAMTGQMVIDLIVGFRAGQRSEMSAISRSIHDLPGFEVFFYGLVPALGLAAVAVLALVAAFRRRVPVWTAAVFLVGSVCIGTGVTALMIAGGAAACVALPGMVRGSIPAPRQTAVAA